MTGSTNVPKKLPTGWLLAWSAALLIIAVLASPPETPPSRMALLAAAVFLVGLFTIVRVSRRGFWAPATLFYLAVGLFHLGLAPSWIRGSAPEFPRSSDYAWFGGPLGSTALWLVTLGLAGYVVGVLLVCVRTSRSALDQAETADTNDRLSAPLATTGSILLLVAIATWAVAAERSGGLGVFVGSYGGFLKATDGSSLGYVYMLIGLGLGLCVIDLRVPLAHAALLVFTAFAVVAFLLGLRGEVLFPSAVAASVLAARRRMPNGAAVLAAMVALLALINGVKQIRATGIAAWSLDFTVFSPIAALEEMGSSIRVVAHVQGWHANNGEPFRHGETYTVAIFRFAERMISPGSRPPASSDFRLMNSEVAARSGNIGGSVVGEALHNFSWIGVPVVLCLIGILFAYFDTRPLSSVRLATYVAIAVPLFNHIRNSFVPVIPSVLFGVLVVVGVIVVARSRSWTVTRQ